MRRDRSPSTRRAPAGRAITRRAYLTGPVAIPFEDCDLWPYWIEEEQEVGYAEPAEDMRRLRVSLDAPARR